MRNFSTLLIANRGEIAVRIIKTARRLGLKTVAIFSEPDRGALHTTLADQAVALGGNTALETYLVIEKIIDACKKGSADAVHPGYGFLSENAEFARACKRENIVFIGPDVDAIEAMGHKSRAKDLVKKADVPLIPGYQGENQSLDFLAQRACEIGFPIMIKAAAGGGGRGLRIAENKASLHDLLLSARAESERAFGSGELLLERALSGASHIEVQVFGDRHGNVVHLGERDCSIQRRHQKVFEESPSPRVSEKLRSEMGECAVRAAKAIDYVGAGTVEFLLDADEKYYFLEMNTRLQVEHPVTECVTGLDLVEWQLRVARGEPLPLKQDEVRFHGHAIEARLYAEDPSGDFRPQTGEILCFNPPSETLARTDHGLHRCDRVSPYYDAMLAKIICHGDDRDMSCRRLQRALEETTLFGIKSNREFLLHCLTQESFLNGQFDTGFIDRVWKPAVDERNCDVNLVAVAAAIFMTGQHRRNDELFGWSSNDDTGSVMKLRVDEREAVKVRARFTSPTELCIWLDGVELMVSNMVLKDSDSGLSSCSVEINGLTHGANYLWSTDQLYVSSHGATHVIEDVLLKPPVSQGTVSDGSVLSPSNGVLGSIVVEVGQSVEKGEALFTVDAMKLLQTVYAPVSGVVSEVLAKAGQQIKKQQLILQIDSEEVLQDTKSGAEKLESLALH